jgi:putative nucleotidyltransferase with HDIG domain
MIPSLEKMLRRGRKRAAGLKARRRAVAPADSARPALVDWRKVAFISLIIAALSFLISVQLVPDRLSLRVGQISPREVRAERTVRYKDQTATEQARLAAGFAVQTVYDSDDGAPILARRTVDEIFHRIDAARRQPQARTAAGSHARRDARIHEPERQLGADFTPDQVRYLLTMPAAVLDKLHTASVRLVADAMAGEIRDEPSGIRRALDALDLKAHQELVGAREAEVIRAVATQALRPNWLLNRKRTAEARAAAARNVAPIFTPILRGDRIVGANEVVTSDQIEKLVALGLLSERQQATTGLAVAGLAAAMVFLVAFYIARTLPGLSANRGKLALFAVINLASVFGLKVGAALLGLQISGGQLGYLGMMGVAAAGMLVSILLDMHLAVLDVALLSALSGLIMNHEIRFTVMSLLSSLVGLMAVGNRRSRVIIQRILGALIATNLGLVWLLGLLLHDSPDEMWTGSTWAIMSALSTTFLFWLGMLVLERPFGILTHQTLLELSAFDRPLLQQFCAVAPGTYAHSMMVGTLAEAGAQAIGADALLCKVGGYYHDIGKIKRPDFFVENQRKENVHGRLSPSLSALIITAHVRDGIDVARDNRLPREIQDIVAQHHGTTLIRYFYHQALADNTDSDVAPAALEERFRYPGPKPRSREAAIVMLADSVEAAARSLDRPTPERLEALVTGIVREKLEDGQFDDCELTFRCIRLSTEAFLHVLKAMMHARIDYPEVPKTASGRPMDVVRPDLRPETFKLAEADSLAMAAMDGAIDPSVGPSAHQRDLQEAFGAGDPASGWEPPAAPAVLPLRNLLSFSVVEPEVLYGRLTAERTETPGSDEVAPPGGPTPADE